MLLALAKWFLEWKYSAQMAFENNASNEYLK